MQIVNVSEKALAIMNPREVFFSMFPQNTPCSHCKSDVIIDGPDDVRYSGSSEYSWAHLYWICSLCGSHNTFSEDTLVLEGYRQYYPRRKTYWQDYGVTTIMVSIMIILIFFIAFGWMFA